MVNTSKILTVSYGTFSCTLEGFDDSFDTMKAIAEYFRDLAADDRYFGAEPPTPDADMLARIAEREIARRVEAHEDQGKIVLRAADAPALAAAAAVAPAAAAPAPAAPQPAPVAEAPVPDTPIADAQPEAEEAPAPEAVSAEAQPAPVDAAPEVEEAPVEAPVAEAPELPAEADIPTEETVEADGAEAPALLEEAADEASESVVLDIAQERVEIPEIDADIAAEADKASETDVEDPIEAAEKFFENSEVSDEEVYFEPEEVEEVSADPDPESVAAKLSRIRSVVSQNDQPYEQADYNEDEHAQDFLNDAAADLDAALAQDDEAEMQAAADPDLDAPEAVSDDEMLAALSIDALTEDDDAEVDDAEGETAEDETVEAEADDGFEDTLSQLLADSISEEDVLDEPVDDTPEAETLAEVDEDDAATDFDDLEDMVEINDDDEARADLNARVIKMKRDDVEAAFAEELVGEDHTEDDVATMLAENDPPTTEDALVAEVAGDADNDDLQLSPEEEEDLQRELAAVEADLGSDIADEAEAPAEVEAEAAVEEVIEEVAPVAVREGRHSLPDADQQSSDIERIFDEADNQLEKPESNQRRSAIQHLRAAVAATRAEKKAGADLQKDVDDSPYRSDLASVVRPRRPRPADGARSERPSEGRPAPLKLVAEQRVDTPSEPIRPRRVSAAELNVENNAKTAENSSNFSDFAEQLGATQLPDLLEAAAAYMSEVEGRDQFSRPMLMHKLQEVEKENFSREDGLRSFGQLLRDGKIQKIKGGRFTVTDETEYRDEARQAG